MSDAAQTTNFIDLPGPPPAGMKRCARCEKDKPEQSFDVKDSATGRRGNVCHTCRSQMRTERLKSGGETAYQRRVKEQLAKIVSQLTDEHPDVPGVAKIAHGLIAGLGGLDSFVGEWVKTLQSDKLSPKIKLENFRAIAKLCAEAGDANSTLQGLKNLTDSDLNELLLDLLSEQMQSRGLRIVDEEALDVAATEPAALPPPATEGAA